MLEPIVIIVFAVVGVLLILYPDLGKKYDFGLLSFIKDPLGYEFARRLMGYLFLTCSIIVLILFILERRRLHPR